MTCIVGVEFDGDVYMGCDSAATDEWYRACTPVDTKVFSNGNMLMGMCGSFRLGQLLQHSLHLPDRGSKVEDDMQYLVNDYIDAVREMLAEKGHIIKGEHVEETIVEGDYLLGYNGHLYIVEENFQLLRTTRGYIATGCGAEFALGVMHYIKTKSGVRDPVKFLLNALEAASEHSSGCAPPHHVFCLDANGETGKVL